MGTLMTPGGDVPLAVTKVYTAQAKLCLGAEVGDWGPSVLEIEPVELWPTLVLAFRGKGVISYAARAFFTPKSKLAAAGPTK
jgi:hypothetical protein